MIIHIEQINDFGIYKNFNWSSSPGIKDFSKKNIFYGWNYSGKTTLSRIFSTLREKELQEGFEKSYFKVKTTNGDFDTKNLDEFPFEVLVFNSDYINDNLNFSHHINHISNSKTILFEVGDNAIYETKIQKIRNEIDQINGTETLKSKKLKFQSYINDFEVYDKSTNGKFTIFAKEIKDEHFISLINFTKANLKSIISTLANNLNQNIISDKKRLTQLSEIVKMNAPKEELERVRFVTNYNNLINSTNEILRNVPEKAELMKLLDKNSDVYSWVKKGREFNKANDRCLFCDNYIDEKRIRKLNEYFNSQASELRVLIYNLNEQINEELANLSLIKLPLSNNDFNLGFANEYSRIKKRLDKCIEAYKKNLYMLKAKLDLKLNKSLHVQVAEIKPFQIESLENLIFEMDTHIERNNEFTNGFEKEIRIVRNIYINHLIASYLKREKYFIKEKKYLSGLAEIKKLEKRVDEYQEEISFYESKKLNDAEGALRYTSFVQRFLNRSEIEIKFDSYSKKFVLLRNNENASNLSDGEKTAIALSHFLVTINSLESIGKFDDLIVFIDDPISSLDGNHIFQINSIFKELFFTKNNFGNEWSLKCRQLFISTHNFDFFNLLRELPKDKSKKESKYYIERTFGANNTSIKPLPQILDKFKSEYHYLFKEIYEFSKLKKPLKSDKLLLLPNTLRRFLEMYTMTKYPINDSVDARADKIFGLEISKRICKPFHYFSHLNNIDRIGKHSEFIADIPNACKELINQIKKKDKSHFEALEIAVNL
jgi:wobble nucleotide-excising tRNase